MRRRRILGTVLATACALVVADRADATGVPVGGFLPLVGIGLSNEYDSEDFTFTAYSNVTQPTNGMMLGNGGTPHFDVALLDTGAGFSLLTAQAYVDFNIDGPYSGNSDGFAGTESIDFGGATGTLSADVIEPLGLYAAGLQSRGGGGGAPFTMNLGAVKGQTNTSMITIPAESDLPNVVGLTYASRYATYIRSDMPQIFELDGRTVRSPYVDFLPLGSGGQGINRRAFMQLTPSASFAGPPVYVFNLNNLDIDEPWKDPSYPTLLQASTGGAFLTVNANENGQNLGNSQFLFDTGADVTVVSSFSANQLGYQGVPDFTVAVVGSGGTAFDVPGFFVDEFTVFAELLPSHAADNVVLHNVPVIILDVTNPGDPGNVVPGIVGTNVIAGRNVVFDPKPAGTGPGPSLYIGDPVTIEKNWIITAASGTFGSGGNWNGGTTPTILGIANVRHVSGGNQIAVVAANATVWEVNVSGTANQTMTLQVQSGVMLQTFSGVNIELGGAIDLQNGTLDTQYVEMLGGTLSGQGMIETGSGPLPGQVENRGGTIAPGNGIGELNIIGRFANGPGGTMAYELGGSAAGQYDKISVTGGATLDGILAVSLVSAFTPSAGDSFTILATTEDIGGTFDHLLLPDGQNWNVNYASKSVQLVVGNPGDFNFDGAVDARDYVVWRNSGLGPLNFSAWRSHFGTTYAGGAGLGTLDAVPEPSGLLALLIAACGLALSRKRR